MVESELVVCFEVSDDLIGIDIFFFKFLVVRATLESISGANIGGHGFVELVGPE